MNHPVKYSLDLVAFAATFAALAKILPPISAALSVVWLSIQIGEWLLKKIRNRK